MSRRTHAVRVAALGIGLAAAGVTVNAATAAVPTTTTVPTTTLPTTTTSGVPTPPGADEPASTTTQPAAPDPSVDPDVTDDSGGNGREASLADRRRAERAARERREARARADARKRDGSAADRRARRRDEAKAAADEADEPAATSDPADAGAVPTAGAPTLDPGALVARFRVPLFLLPIYQAAANEYGIPWTVLAAINEVETDYGRNVAVSSAGAQGWMQFMPSTWKQYGVDANGDGTADPANPVDAIFAAARYLRAAGGDTDVRKAVFAYNHAGWYVDSVLLRARALDGLPSDLVGALTGLTQGTPPVPGAAASDVRQAPGPAATVDAPRGSAVVAVQDGTVTAVGRTAGGGRRIELRDAYGNRYTYSGLGRVRTTVPGDDGHATAAAPARIPPKDPAPTAPAAAGTPRPGTAAARPAATPTTSPDARGSTTLPDPKPAATVNPPAPGTSTRGTLTPPTRAGRPRPSSSGAARSGTLVAPSAGGPAPIRTTRASTLLRSAPSASREATAEASRRTRTLSAADAASSSQTSTGATQPLRAGARVTSGTVLATTGTSGVTLRIRPAGTGAPLVDPRPILGQWRTLGRVAGSGSGTGASSKDAPFQISGAPRADGSGATLLLGKAQLERRVLADDRLDVYPAGRAQIEAGQIDRRVLATLAYLSASGHRLRISSLRRPGAITTSGNESEHDTGAAVDIAEIDGQTVSPATQGPGSVTERVERLLVALQGAARPHQIISLIPPSRFGGATNVLALPDHADHLHVGFADAATSGGSGSDAGGTASGGDLKASEWRSLLDRAGTDG